MLKVSSRLVKNSALVVLMLVQLMMFTASPVWAAGDTFTPQQAEPALADAELRRLHYYLLQGQQALADQRLLWPKGDNAYEWFQQALSIDGQQPEAHAGMRQIGQAYLALAQQAYSAGHRAEAELMLQRGQYVSLSPAQAAALSQRYPAPAVAANEFALPLADLSQKNERVIEQLGQLALRAKALPSRLLIVARSDREGRWIYKQMRDSVAGYRLRGNIKLGRVPKIVFIDMPGSAVPEQASDS